MIDHHLAALVQYGLDTGLIEPADTICVTNRLLEILQLDSCEQVPAIPMALEEILRGLLQDTVSRGICADNQTSRDLFDTRLMGALTPMPREVRAGFAARYAQSPELATE